MDRAGIKRVLLQKVFLGWPTRGIGRFTGDCSGCDTPPNVFAPFGNSVIILYHSVNSAVILHLVVGFLACSSGLEVDKQG